MRTVSPRQSAASAPASLLVVTGMSGGGKSVALNTFEDLGFYCVDNLPAELLPEFVRSAGHPGRTEQKLAVGIDMRNRGDLARVPEWLSAVGAMGLEPKIVYIEMPETLRSKYQYFTQADAGKLRAAGYAKPFTALEDGIRDYVQGWLAKG